MFSYPFPPNATAGAVRSERFARYLSDFGWAVDVVTIRPRHDLYADITRLDSLGTHVKVHPTVTLDPWLWLVDKKLANIFFRAFRSVLMNIFSFPDHMLLWAPFAAKQGLAIHKQTRVDAIYTTSPPHSTHLAGLLLARLIKKPWVADFRDPWTLNAYREKCRLRKAFLKIEQVMEKAVLEKADIVLANTVANRSNLLKAFPSFEDKVIHLPNGLEEFPEQAYRKTTDSPFTIVHAGTFYPRFRPYALLYALAAWRNGERTEGIPPLKNLSVILLGARDAETKRLVRELGLEDIVQIKPWVALNEARQIMCQADALWASLGTGEESSTFLPSKLFEYIAAQKPIIGFFPEGEAASLIKSTGTGMVFNSDDPMPIIESLNRLCLARGNNHQISTICRRREEVIASYHISEITGRLAEILDQVASVPQH